MERKEISRLLKLLRELNLAQQLGVLGMIEGMQIVHENKKQRINRRFRSEHL